MVVGEIERHDVWLALVGARQPPKIRTGQQVQTLLPAQFLDQHDYDSLASPLCGGIYLRRWRIGIHIQSIGSLLVPREIGNLAKVFIKSRARTALKIVSVSVEAPKCIRPRHLPAVPKPPS